MERTDETLTPKTVAERDAITALKLAIGAYEPCLYSKVFTSGKCRAGVYYGRITWLKSVLNDVDVDRYGRDADGVDIRAALKVLGEIEPII